MHRFAVALASKTKLSDADFAEIEKAIGREGIAEVLVLLGYYTSVALGMKVHEVPIPLSPKLRRGRARCRDRCRSCAGAAPRDRPTPSR